MIKWIKSKTGLFLNFALAGWFITYGLNFSIWAGVIAMLFSILLGVWKDKKSNNKTFETTIFVGSGAILAFVLKLLQHILV